MTFSGGDGGGATTLSLPKIKQKQKQKTTVDRIKKKHLTIQLNWRPVMFKLCIIFSSKQNGQFVHIQHINVNYPLMQMLKTI